jgi:hypothetical protein
MRQLRYVHAYKAEWNVRFRSEEDISRQLGKRPLSSGGSIALSVRHGRQRDISPRMNERQVSGSTHPKAVSPLSTMTRRRAKAA